jgi:glutathione S-transferase
MKLFYNSFSPFARMCLVTARELGLDRALEIVRTEGGSPALPNAGILKHNPLGLIPTLVTDHGHAMYDSRVICEYFAHRAGNKFLLPDEPVKRFRILTLQALGIGISDAAVALRYELAARPEAARWAELIARYKQRILAACDELESSWLNELGETTLGSIAVAAALSYVDLRHDELGWRRDHTGLAKWMGGFSARPSMGAF